MAEIPAFFLPHSVRIEPRTGSGGLGTVRGAAVTVRAMVEEGSRLVRGRDGREVVSTARVHCNFSVVAPVDSKVTLWPGTARERQSKVIEVSGADHPSVPGFQTLALE